jgi:hypothetical protein
VSFPQFINATRVYIETNDRGPGPRKGNGDRKTHITQTDNCDFP